MNCILKYGKYRTNTLRDVAFSIYRLNVCIVNHSSNAALRIHNSIENISPRPQLLSPCDWWNMAFNINAQFF